MTIEKMKKELAGTMAYCVEDGCTGTIRVSLSDGNSIDIWYFEELACYVWSGSTSGYADLDELTDAFAGWLEEKSLEATKMEIV